MAPVNIPGLNISLVNGPLVLGFLWANMLYGIFLCQTYLYFLNFPKDPTWMKRLVFLIFIFEGLFMVFATIAAWMAFGPGWGDIDSILNIHWAWVPMTPLNAVPAWMVQSFFVWRIWQLGKNIYICIFIELLSLVQLISAFYFCIKTTMLGLTAAALFTQTPGISAWLACSAACDIMITLTIITLLYRKNRDTSFEKTSSLLTRLIRFTVETGFITSIAAIFELISWLVAHQISVHYIGYLAFGKLYANTLLATLNSRAFIFGGSPTTHSMGSGTLSGAPIDFRGDVTTAGMVRTNQSLGTNSAVPVHYHGVKVNNPAEVHVSSLNHPYSNPHEAKKEFLE